MDIPNVEKKVDGNQEIRRIVDFLKSIEGALNDSAKLAKYVTNANAAYINILDNKKQYTVASAGNGHIDDIPIDYSICRHTIKKDSPLVITDATNEVLTKDLPSVLDGTVKFYTGIPIQYPHGKNFSTLCVVDTQEREIRDDQLEALQQIASQVTVWFELFQKQAEQEALQESQQRLETLFSEIHHRIKNNLADISGLLQIQESETSIKEVREILQKTERRISTVAQIHEILYESNTYTKTNIRAYVNKLIATIAEVLIDEKDIRFEVNIDPIHLDINQTLPFGLILNEMVTNAIEHAFTDQDEGVISIDITEDEGYLTLQLSDNGKGLGDGDFSLFDFGNLGMTLIHLLSRQLKANIQIHSNTGTAYYMRFPIS